MEEGADAALQPTRSTLTFRNNLAYHNEYGVMDADGQGFATTALNADVNAYVWTHNALANRDGKQTYPNVPVPISERTPGTIQDRLLARIYQR